MTETFIGVRDVNQETFRKFKVATLSKKMTLGKALTRAMEDYIQNQDKKDSPKTRNFLNFKPIKIGKKVKWSEEIDETLYK